MIDVSVIGASGYTGGETLRLLLSHPHINLVQATSESNAGKFVHSVHPNLRKRTDLKFVSSTKLNKTNLAFLCLPHGTAMQRIRDYGRLAERLIDLSADFRLHQSADYLKWYGHEHADPEFLNEAVYGIPELHREKIQNARLVTGAGCLATTSILGLYPLFKQGIVRDESVFIEGKVGSSAAGNNASLATHHPERSGALRSFQPTRHRHTAEIEQELTFDGWKPKVYFSATATDAVRGILSTAQVLLRDPLEEKDIWRIYRQQYGSEPFIRIVKERTGVYRYPEPKILVGSNYCDVGFELDPIENRLVVLSALDNLMKGAAGNGVQAMNVMYGWEETTGLEFPGLHPV
ncbi:MAG TPA: N-acetyl-gamma-glutamyl-phosphate reductase [Terriglobia bacterium]|nr:N-acetyl-gamma-glutamyl-phosphate reductase [Terriglobia bacterium]